MPRRVNPIILLGLVLVLALSIGFFASAQLGGGTASDAVAVGEAQVGKPFAWGTDGPGTFSCVGLMRYILRTIGVDANAPWVPEEYLSRYTPVDLANLQPGDIVIMPGWATMYVGNGMLLNANEALGTVTHTPMSNAGAPLGAVRPPYGGSQVGTTQPVNDTTQPVATEPVPTEQQQMLADPLATEQPVADPLAAQPLPTDSLATDPLAIQPLAADPLAAQPVGVDPVATDPLAAQPVATESVTVEPLPVTESLPTAEPLPTTESLPPV